jgi:two-component system, OmpR family, KDP operon response regulator KdpE
MRILIIDDDTGMTDLLTILLTPASTEVLTANTARAGVQMIHDQPPDVVILDLILPELNGIDLCREIREFSTVPILVLSALDSPGMVAQALDSGADDYLTKPTSSGTLIAHLKKLVRRSSMLKKNNSLLDNNAQHPEPAKEI